MSTPPSNRPKVDPWEAREREKQRWSDHAAGKSSRSSRSGRSSGGGSGRSSRSARREESSGPVPENERGLRNNVAVLGLLFALALLIGAEVPQFDGTTRSWLVRGGAALLLLVVGISRSYIEPILPALRHGPNPFIVALVAWSGLSFFLAPFKEFAAVELLRVVSGVGAYLLCAYGLRSRQIPWTVAGLLGIGVLMSLLDFAIMGQRGTGKAEVTLEYSAFGTHENVGSLLVLLLPPALALALHTGVEEKRRLSAMAVTLVLGSALLVARTRSAWAGGLIALVFLTFLLLRYGPQSEDTRDRNTLQRFLASPVFVIALGFVLFVSATGVAPLILKRASVGNVLLDDSLQERMVLWRGAAQMASEKPLTGWGIGSFPVLQGAWTHTGEEAVLVLTQGFRHENIAHNYYTQWASDTGFVGLALYVGCVGAFLLCMVRGIKQVRSPFGLALACGSVAAVAGSVIDAIASPAYNFAGPYTMLWAWMGLGVAALRNAPRRDESLPAPAIAPTPRLDRALALVAGLVVAAGVVGWGGAQIARGKALPRGTFEIVATPPRPLFPGESVLWEARFTDEKGKSVNTYPGTFWQLQGELANTSRADARISHTKNKYSLGTANLRLTPPATIGNQVSVRARYRDRLGRWYDAYSAKSVDAKAAKESVTGM